MIIYVLLLIAFRVETQININKSIIINTNSPSDRFTCAALRDNGTTIIVGNFTYNFHLTKFNITENNKIKVIGSYYFNDQTSPYRYLYFINDYILAFSTANKPKIFNEKTLKFLKNFNYNGIFSRGKLIESKNLFVFT
jgi:hypothetical protein